VTQPRAAVQYGVLTPSYVVKAIVLDVGDVGGSFYVCWSGGNLVLFKEQENCNVRTCDNVAQSSKYEVVNQS